MRVFREHVWVLTTTFNEVGGEIFKILGAGQSTHLHCQQWRCEWKLCYTCAQNGIWVMLWLQLIAHTGYFLRPLWRVLLTVTLLWQCRLLRHRPVTRHGSLWRKFCFCRDKGYSHQATAQIIIEREEVVCFGSRCFPLMQQWNKQFILHQIRPESSGHNSARVLCNICVL